MLLFWCLNGPVEFRFTAVTTWVGRSDYEEEHGDGDLLDRRSQPP
jgi:hypothetical protein